MKWQLIYRGSIHGLNATAFHTRCDKKGETFNVLSSTRGYLFGGYTDANWNTALDDLPTYGRSEKTFLFSLVSPEKYPARKFRLDVRYPQYVIVNDLLSGPIFGGMMRPDIGILESNGQFRCQVHFPSLYKSETDVSPFPTSDGCIIDEIEVFIPVFKTSTSVSFWLLKKLAALILTLIGSFVFGFVGVYYNRRERLRARLSSCLSLLFVWMNYWWGTLLLLGLLFLLLLVRQWHQRPQSSVLSYDIQIEKRLIMSAFVALLVCMILFC